MNILFVIVKNKASQILLKNLICILFHIFCDNKYVMTHSEEIKFLGYTILVQVPLYLIHPGLLEDISGILPFTTPSGGSDNV